MYNLPFTIYHFTIYDLRLELLRLLYLPTLHFLKEEDAEQDIAERMEYH